MAGDTGGMQVACMKGQPVTLQELCVMSHMRDRVTCTYCIHDIVLHAVKLLRFFLLSPIAGQSCYSEHHFFVSKTLGI
jgi:hypothetical protein